MKYTDYRIENLVFMKGVDNWTTEEKKEFLETCPENQDLPQILAELETIKKAIEDGEIKTNKYDEINVSSIKAYLVRNNMHIQYGCPNHSGYYSSDYKTIYFRVDGTHQSFNRASGIDYIVKRFTEDTFIDDRFKKIVDCYRNRELNWSKRIEDERYTTINKDRIEANERLRAIFNSLSICVPLDVKETGIGGGYYSCGVYRFDPTVYRYRHTQYGEITVDNNPLSKETADKLCDAITEMSAKIQEVTKEYETVFAEVFGKRTDE